MGAALVVPLVSVIVPAIVSIVHDLIQLFKKEPKQPAVTDAGAGAIGLTKDEAIRSARETFGLDAVRNWNFGIIGQVKAGKSSLVNAVQGLKDNEPGKSWIICSPVCHFDTDADCHPTLKSSACLLCAGESNLVRATCRSLIGCQQHVHRRCPSGCCRSRQSTAVLSYERCTLMCAMGHAGS